VGTHWLTLIGKGCREPIAFVEQHGSCVCAWDHWRRRSSAGLLPAISASGGSCLSALQETREELAEVQSPHVKMRKALLTRRGCFDGRPARCCGFALQEFLRLRSDPKRKTQLPCCSNERYRLAAALPNESSAMSSPQLRIVGRRSPPRQISGLSVSCCRMRQRRLLPRAVRIAISLRRAADRATRR